MSLITAKFIKNQLYKIAFLLKSDYNKILDPRTLRFINSLDVTWSKAESWVSGRSVKEKSDIKPDDKIWFESRNKTTLKNITIIGYLEESKKEIKLTIDWVGNNAGRLWTYIVEHKDEHNNWIKLEPVHTQQDVSDQISKLENSSTKERVDLKEIYKSIFFSKKESRNVLALDISDFMKKNTDYSFIIQPKVSKTYLSLMFKIPNRDESDKIINEIKEKNIPDKLISFLQDKAEKNGFDKNDFMLIPNFTENSWSIKLRKS